MTVNSVGAADIMCRSTRLRALRRAMRDAALVLEPSSYKSDDVKRVSRVAQNIVDAYTSLILIGCLQGSHIGGGWGG